MSKSKLEYIWLDGYQPTQSLRSKTKIVADFSGSKLKAVLLTVFLSQSRSFLIQIATLPFW